MRIRTSIVPPQTVTMQINGRHISTEATLQQLTKKHGWKDCRHMKTGWLVRCRFVRWKVVT